MIRAVFFDLSGVLYEDNAPYPGAVELVARLQESGVPLRFLTNTSTKDHQQVYAQLQQMGFVLDSEQLFTAVDAVIHHLKKHRLTAFCLNHPNIDQSLSDFWPETDSDIPDTVVVTDAAEDFEYHRLNRAFQYLMQGAELIAIGDNKYFQRDGELCLDAGPFIHALAYAADVSAHIMGKPATEFFHSAVDTLGLQASEVLMIGDDVQADIAGAQHAGLQACLVKTGKYREGDEKRVPDALLADNATEAIEQFYFSGQGGMP